jgi:hypothetical protein
MLIGDFLSRGLVRDQRGYGRIQPLFVEDGGKLIKNSSEAPEVSTVDQFIASRQKLSPGRYRATLIGRGQLRSAPVKLTFTVVRWLS